VLSAREWLDFATERVPQMQEAKMKQVEASASRSPSRKVNKISRPEKRSVQRRAFSIAESWRGTACHRQTVKG